MLTGSLLCTVDVVLAGHAVLHNIGKNCVVSQKKEHLPRRLVHSHFVVFFFFPDISQMKLGALKFLAHDLFEPSDVICHFLAATGDTRHRHVY